MAIGANHSCKHNKRMWDSLQVHKQDAPLLLPTCILKVEKRESNTSYVLKTDKPKRWAQITHCRCTHKATRDARCTKSGKSCQKKKLTQITGHLIEFYLQDGWHMTLNNFFLVQHHPHTTQQSSVTWAPSSTHLIQDPRMRRQPFDVHNDSKWLHSYFDWTHIYIARGKNDWNCKKESIGYPERLQKG